MANSSISRGTSRVSLGQRNLDSQKKKRQTQIAQGIIKPSQTSTIPQQPQQPQQNMSPVVPASIDPNLQKPQTQGVPPPVSMSPQGGANPSGGNVLANTAKGLARVSTIGSASRFAQGIKEGEGFNPSRLAEGNSALGESFAIQTPEQQAQAKDALRALEITATVASVASVVKSALSSGLKIGSKAGTEYATAREALKAGDTIGFAKNVKNVAFSKQMIEAAFINSKTGQVSAVKTLAVAGGAAFFVAKMLDTYPFASWSRTEAQEIMNFGLKEAIKNGDPQLIEEGLALQQEILARDAWENIAEKIPWVNIKEGFNEKYNALQFQAKVSAQVVRDLQAAANSSQISQGGTSSNGWDANVWLETKEKANIAEIETQKTISENWNNSRKDMIKWERAAAVQARNEDADFWRKERELSFKKEAEEREKAAQFWMEYRKKIKEFEEDNGPSTLSFGLLQ